MSLRVPLMAALTVSALAPAVARAEARPADRLTTTAGSTTLLRPLSGKGAIRSSRVTIDLYGDHATITQDVTAAAAGEAYEVLAPLSRPDQGPWPGHVAAGEFPSFVALGEGGRPLDVKTSPGTAAVGRLVGQWRPEGGGGSFVVDRSPTEVRRHVVSAPRDARVRVVWTVPYLGDSYRGIRPLDCTCGDSWNFTVHMIGLVIDPAGGVPSELAIENHTGASTVWRQAGKDDGGRGKWEPTIRAGHRDTGAIDKWPGDKVPGGNALRIGVPFSFTFGASSWKDDYPTTDLRISCHSAQEDDDNKGVEEGGPAVDARRRKRLARDRAAFRWDATCVLGDKTSLSQGAPSFLRLDGSESAWPRKDWFIRGLAREVLGAWGGTWWPHGTHALPLLQTGLIHTVAAARTVQASSTLPSKDNRYRAENVVDWNPMTAWCAGEAADGRGVARIEVALSQPSPVTGLAILPGYVKADWLYEETPRPAACG